MSDHRLPRCLVPKHYQLRIVPDLEALTFSGKAVISVEVKKSTNLVRLNSLDLDIAGVRVFEGDEEIPVEKVDVVADKEELRVTLGRCLKSGVTGTIRIDYAGKINSLMRGFHRSVQPSGQVAASCHFEASSARMAFPCWDDPSFRAVFQVEVAGVDQDLVVLSNMPVKEEIRENENKVTYRFEETPAMPTYIVCWCVGHYDFVEAKTVGQEIPVRVYTPKGKAHQGELALKAAVGAMDYYREFFSTDYTLPKIDLITISDFPIGAMENWGLLTFQDIYLLADETTAAFRKQYVALIVAHEVAHQWFGNLVTLEWWSDLWLKEGYATWIQWLCVDHLYPDWNIWTQFLSSTVCNARRLDMLSSSHPIEVEVTDPADVEEVFDTISYHKGGALIWMLYHWLGTDAFRSGMKQYLQKYVLGNARTKDLWAVLEADSGKEVGKVMSSWTRQKGFPLITVTHSSQDTSNEVTVTLRQSDEAWEKDNKEEKREWGVPFNVTSRSSPKVPIHSGLLIGDECTFNLKNLDITKDWINVNPSGVGFYKVSYPRDLLQLMASSVRDGSLPAADRLCLLIDQQALTVSGMTSTKDLMILCEAYRDETDPVVWRSLCNCLGEVKMMVREDEECSRLFSKWCRWLLEKAYVRLGWDASAEGDHHLTSLFRRRIINFLVDAGDETVLAEGARRFEENIATSADLSTSTYAAKLKLGGNSAFDALVALSKEVDSAEIRRNVYDALGASDQGEILRRGLEFSMSEDVKSQDVKYIFISIGEKSFLGQSLIWKFFCERLPELRKRFERGPIMTTIVEAATEGFSSYPAADEIEHFFKDHPLRGIERTVSQMLEGIRMRAAWKERDLEAVEKYLKEKRF